jgi:hypothetical protein
MTDTVVGSLIWVVGAALFRIFNREGEKVEVRKEKNKGKPHVFHLFFVLFAVR